MGERKRCPPLTGRRTFLPSDGKGSRLSSVAVPETMSAAPSGRPVSRVSAIEVEINREPPATPVTHNLG